MEDIIFGIWLEKMAEPSNQKNNSWEHTDNLNKVTPFFPASLGGEVLEMPNCLEYCLKKYWHSSNHTDSSYEPTDPRNKSANIFGIGSLTLKPQMLLDVSGKININQPQPRLIKLVSFHLQVHWLEFLFVQSADALGFDVGSRVALIEETACSWWPKSAPCDRGTYEYNRLDLSWW